MNAKFMNALRNYTLTGAHAYACMCSYVCLCVCVFVEKHLNYYIEIVNV